MSSACTRAGCRGSGSPGISAPLSARRRRSRRGSRGWAEAPVRRATEEKRRANRTCAHGTEYDTPAPDMRAGIAELTGATATEHCDDGFRVSRGHPTKGADGVAATTRGDQGGRTGITERISYRIPPSISTAAACSARGLQGPCRSLPGDRGDGREARRRARAVSIWQGDPAVHARHAHPNELVAQLAKTRVEECAPRLRRTSLSRKGEGERGKRSSQT